MRHPILRGWGLVLPPMFLLAGAAYPLAALAATFTVVNTNDSGPGSLRQAILDANATPAADIITFNIPGAGVKTIAPAALLPSITRPVTIDGYSQPGSRRNTLAAGSNAVIQVVINGANAGAGPGLNVRGGSSTISGLVIQQCSGDGILLQTGGRNVVEGCFIGTNTAGTAAVPNGGSGVHVEDSAANLIGGTSPGARNLLSGNGSGIGVNDPAFIHRNGVHLTGAGATGNRVEGNLIGTNAAGTVALPNLLHGVRILDRAQDNVIGGATAGARNVISGNINLQAGFPPGFIPLTYEIVILGDGTDGNLVQGNYIGTGATGAAPLPGARAAGILIMEGAARNSIGGPTSRIGSPPGNVILCASTGIDFGGISSGGAGNIVQGNFIGPRADGTVALGRGNGADGIFINGTPDTSVIGNFIAGNQGGGVLYFNGGGTELSSGLCRDNIIGLNEGEGVLVETDTVVENNFIGTNQAGANLRNTGAGVLAVATNNTIRGNTVAFNGTAGQFRTGGVVVSSGTGNRIQGNRVFSNAGLGIDLGDGGITPNDDRDPDQGANNLQNFPILTSAVRSGTSTTVRGTLNSTPNTTFTLEFFANTTRDPAGNGEGETPLLPLATVTTNAGGSGTFSVVLNTAVPTGRFMSATATDPRGNTSEFAPSDVRVTGGPQLPTLSINDAVVTEGDSGTRNAVFTVTLSAASAQQVTAAFATADGTATAGQDYQARTGTVTFPAGTTTRQVTIPVIGDTVLEPDETFLVNLSAPVGATLADAQGQGTINNDEPRDQPTLSIDDVQVTEGDNGTRDAVFTVTLTVPVIDAAGLQGTGGVTVRYATQNGTATAGQDYQARTGTLEFLKSNTATIRVPVNGDTTVEPNETFFVNLSQPTGGAVIGDGRGQGTIVNDDQAEGPTFSIDNVEITEGDAGTRDAVFTVTLNFPNEETAERILGGGLSVRYVTADGTARAGQDYQARNGTLEFIKTNTRTLAVPIIGDRVREPDETFFVNLSAATGGTVLDGRGQGTILNDDEGQPGRGRVVAAPDPVDFGEQEVGERESRRVRVRNTGNGPVIVRVLGAGRPFSARRRRFTLAPGAQQVVVVRFRPRREGKFRDTLRLATDAPGQARVGVALLGCTCKRNPFD